MIVLRSDDEIATIRKAGKILAATLEKLRSVIEPGIRTSELDAIARQEILSRNGYPAFKGYNGYPANICTSVNNVVVHGIPSQYKLKDGDIISMDVGVRFREYNADAAITVGVGRVSPEAKKLMLVTEKSLSAGIANAAASKRLHDISASIQEYVESNGFSVVRAFVGHGIGTRIHEDPEVPNFGKRGTGLRLAAGMVLAIEPMVNAGTSEVEVLEDGWTAVTRDGKLSAHFEHTIAIREDCVEILTA